MRGEGPQNCVARVLASPADDFEAAMSIAGFVIKETKTATGSVSNAIAYISRRYKLKPSWLQRLWEGRDVPIYRYAYNNLLIALDDLIAKREAEIELEKARFEALRNSNAARESSSGRMVMDREDRMAPPERG